MSRNLSAQGRKTLSCLVVRTVSRWKKWKAAREIEAMPFDLKKDVGWPGGQA